MRKQVSSGVRCSLAMPIASEAVHGCDNPWAFFHVAVGRAHALSFRALRRNRFRRTARAVGWPRVST